jgi:threonine/homoserine/homoserine lactone efflux protein
MINTEIVLTTLAAMLSPTTLSFSVLALVLSNRPRRTGWWFYAGALGATLAIGVLAAFVLGNKAASHGTSTPKTWVAWFDIVAGIALLIWVITLLRKPRNPERAEKMANQMSKVASSPAIAIVGAGASLANPGGFIPIALKDISQMNPSTAEYIVNWAFFSLVSLLPLLLALIALWIAPEWAMRILQRARDWLIRNGRIIAAVIIVALALVLVRNGVTGLV